MKLDDLYEATKKYPSLPGFIYSVHFDVFDPQFGAPAVFSGIPEMAAKCIETGDFLKYIVVLKNCPVSDVPFAIKKAHSISLRAVTIDDLDKMPTTVLNRINVESSTITNPVRFANYLSQVQQCNVINWMESTPLDIDSAIELFNNTGSDVEIMFGLTLDEQRTSMTKEDGRYFVANTRGKTTFNDIFELQAFCVEKNITEVGSWF